MITKIKSLKSNHLDIHNVKRKQLSIQFSLDGFSFSVFDLELQEFILFVSYEFNSKKNSPENLLIQVKQVFTSEQILFLQFEKVLVIHVNNLASFVPFSLFDEDHLETYVKFNNKIYNSDFFVYDYVLNHDMVAVFVPYVHINNFLIDQFGSFEYKHYSSILVENLLNNYASKDQSNCYINVSKSHFEIIISQQKKLRLYNTFEYSTVEDFIYYVLFALEQLNLDVENIQVDLLGLINKKSALFEVLYTYIRNVRLLNYIPNYNSVLEIDNMVQRENFCIFNAID